MAEPIHYFGRFSFGWLINQDGSLGRLAYTNIPYNSGTGDHFKVFSGQPIDLGLDIGRLTFIGPTTIPHGSGYYWRAETPDHSTQYAFSWVQQPPGSGAENGARLVIDKQPLGRPPPLSMKIDTVAGDDVINNAEAQHDITISGTELGEDARPIKVTLETAQGHLDSPPVLYTLNTIAKDGLWKVSLPSNQAKLLPNVPINVHAVADDPNFQPAADPSTDRPIHADLAPPPPHEIIIRSAAGGDDNISADEANHDVVISGDEVGEDGHRIAVDVVSFTDSLIGEPGSGGSTPPIAHSFHATTIAGTGTWSYTIPAAEVAKLLAPPAAIEVPRSMFVHVAIDDTDEGVQDGHVFSALINPPPPPPPPPPPSGDDMSVFTYDETKSDLQSLLHNDGADAAVTNQIVNALTFRTFPDDPVPRVPVEFVNEGSVGTPIPTVQDGHSKNPQMLNIETSGNTVDLNLNTSLRTVVLAGDDNATLEITGTHASLGIYAVGDGSDTITSSNTGAHETLQGGDANALELHGGSGARNFVMAGHGDADTITLGDGAKDLGSVGDGDGDSLVAGSGASQTLLAGDGDHDFLQAGSGSHQSLKSGLGDLDTLVAGTGNDTLDAAGDHTLFEIAHTGSDTILTHNDGLGSNDTVSFDHDQTNMSISTNAATDVTTVKFSDTSQTVKIIGDDDVTLHFGAGSDIHLT